MSILLRDLRLYGSATMADDDTPTAIGGAIDLTKRVVFVDEGGDFQAVSSAAADTTQTVTVSYRDAGGAIQTQAFALNGRTPVLHTMTADRILKAVKGASCAGDVAIENQTPVRTTNTAQAGSADDITLDAGASGSDDAYRGMIIRLNGGTGQYQIRHIISYNGTTKKATVSSAWGTNPDGTSTFIISKGFYFELAPTEALEVRRAFYNAAADPPAGSAKTYYEKCFFKNCHGSLTLTGATVKENADPSGLVTFTLETTNNGSGTNGANNRQVAPVSGVGTFSSADQNPAGSQMDAADRVGVWLKLSLAAGTAAQNTTYTVELTGTTT